MQTAMGDLRNYSWSSEGRWLPSGRGSQMAGAGQYDLFLVGHDRQVEYVVEHYPRDLLTTFITGNHDLSYLKSVGMVIGIK